MGIYTIGTLLAIVLIFWRVLRMIEVRALTKAMSRIVNQRLKFEEDLRNGELVLREDEISYMRNLYSSSVSHVGQLSIYMIMLIYIKHKVEIENHNLKEEKRQSSFSNVTLRLIVEHFEVVTEYMKDKHFMIHTTFRIIKSMNSSFGKTLAHFRNFTRSIVVSGEYEEISNTRLA